MFYLSGSMNLELMRDGMARGAMGFLQTPGAGYSLTGVKVWALDNGCFTGKYPGDEGYLMRLDKWSEHKDRCLFVAVPDVLGDRAATLARWPLMSERIRRRGYEAALVAQDGMTPQDLPTGLEWLFIGGTTAWKMSSACERLISAAQVAGVRVHVGRVNSWRRYQWFAELGCDTCDGTHIAFAPDVNYPKILGWMDRPLQGKFRLS